MNIKLTRAPEGFYLLVPSDDKLHIKILDAILFLITQVELKPRLLSHANLLGMNRKAHPVTRT